MDQVPVRIDGDLAASLKSEADKLGLPLTTHLNAYLRRALHEARETRPVYIPPGRDPSSIREFKQEPGLNRKRLWVFRDMTQSLVWMLPAAIEAASDLFIVVRPSGGRAVAIGVDTLIAWPEYKADLERLTLMHAWFNSGAVVHPGSSDQFRPSP